MFKRGGVGGRRAAEMARFVVGEESKRASAAVHGLYQKNEEGCSCGVRVLMSARREIICLSCVNG